MSHTGKVDQGSPVFKVLKVLSEFVKGPSSPVDGTSME